CPAVLRVLGILNCAEERVRTARDMGDYPPLGQVEGRDELGRVEDREPARGSRAEVVDAAAPAEAADGGVNECSKVLEHLGAGADGEPVVCGAEPEHLHGRERIERQRRGQTLLRGGERIRWEGFPSRAGAESHYST